MGIKRHHLLISGRVQGVNYRMSAWEQARKLGLTGWVSNLADGRVELVIEGDEAALRTMTTWAQQGPRFAHVTHIETEVSEASGEFVEFQIH